MNADKNASDFSLSNDDVSRLMSDPSSSVRTEIAEKIFIQYNKGGLSDSQKELAEQIFRLLIGDAEASVRKVMANHIKDCTHIPHDIAVKVIKDIDEISVPVIECSDVLNDDDLIALLNETKNPQKYLAVSRRKSLSEKIISMLLGMSNVDVTAELLRHQKDNVSEGSLEKIVLDFSDNENVMGAMISRENIPPKIAAKLAEKITDTLRAKLSEKYKGALDKLDEITKKSTREAAFDIMGMKVNNAEYRQFIDTLKESGKIAPIAALCSGNFNLFEVSMARLANVTVSNAKQLIADPSGQGLKVIYSTAYLPENLFLAVRILVRVTRDIDEEINKGKAILPSEYLQRLYDQVIMLTQEQEIENLHFLLTLVKENCEHQTL